MSQLPKGHKTTPKDFVLRNRTMALISDATIIVEAGETSGSLHQGWEALRLGRSLFIWKSILANPHLTWPTKMMRSGAMELSDVGDVLEALPSSLPLPYHGPKIMIDEPAPTNMTPQNVVDSANPRSSSSLMLQLRHAA